MKKSTFLLIFILFCLFGCQSSPTEQRDAAFYKSIGTQIRAARLEQGLSQATLADSVSISQSSLSLIEDGMASPIATKLVDIEAFLQTTFVIDGQQISIKDYLQQQK